MLSYETIRSNINAITAELPPGVTLLAATKTVPARYINFAADCGIRVIGENRVNELLEKYEEIDKSRLEIHFIGRLQTNKVKYIIDKVSLIHSVDSLRLAEEISRRALSAGRVMPVLVQVNLGGEETKGGVTPESAASFVGEISALKGIKTRGLMAIPPKSENKEKNIAFFRKIQKIFIDISVENVDNVNSGLFSEDMAPFDILSIGMSADFRQAIKCGSTLIRVGEGIFGNRKQN